MKRIALIAVLMFVHTSAALAQEEVRFLYRDGVDVKFGVNIVVESEERLGERWHELVSVSDNSGKGIASARLIGALLQVSLQHGDGDLLEIARSDRKVPQTEAGRLGAFVVPGVEISLNDTLQEGEIWVAKVNPWTILVRLRGYVIALMPIVDGACRAAGWVSTACGLWNWVR